MQLAGSLSRVVSRYSRYFSAWSCTSSTALSLVPSHFKGSGGGYAIAAIAVGLLRALSPQAKGKLIHGVTVTEFIK